MISVDEADIGRRVVNYQRRIQVQSTCSHPEIRALRFRHQALPRRTANAYGHRRNTPVLFKSHGFAQQRQMSFPFFLINISMLSFAARRKEG
jgi:hypothetical protein